MNTCSQNRHALLPFAIALGMGTAFLAQSETKADAPKTEDGSPDIAWLNDITRIPPGENGKIDPVFVEYNLSWNNVLNAGKLNVGVQKSEEEGDVDSPAIYLGGASGKSSGMARVLWPYDFEAASVVRQEDLRPIAFNLKEKERNRTLDYHILFESKQLVCSTTKPKDDGTEESVTHLLTYKHDFGQDLLSAILYLRSLPLNDGDEVSMVVTPFNRPYLAKFTVDGREKKKVKGTKYNTIKLSCEIGKIKKDLTIENYDKMKTATLWITEDEFRLPLELHADLFIGFVSARMTEREWTNTEIDTPHATPPPSESGDAPEATSAQETEAPATPPNQPERFKKKGPFKRLFGG